ncbi:hypothetical protein HMI62_24845 [Serratia marcescens]|nr:hypothetical protein HMI62_24845 [Serratia marcescens]
MKVLALLRDNYSDFGPTTSHRKAQRTPHIHLSVTPGGLCLKHGIWRPIYFKKKIVERYWRQAAITLLRECYASLNLPAADYQPIRDYREWCQFLEAQFQRRSRCSSLLWPSDSATPHVTSES